VRSRSNENIGRAVPAYLMPKREPKDDWSNNESTFHPQISERS